jgi:dienelactone hydrolase
VQQLDEATTASRVRLPTRAGVRGTAGAVVLAVAVALPGGACAGNDNDSDASDGPSGDAAAAGHSAADAPPAAPFAVGHRAMTLVDESRSTDAVPAAGVEAQSDRTIVLDVLYPAEGEPSATPIRPETGAGKDGTGGTAVDDADPVDGQFPLVVFAHGWNGRGANFVGFGERWAREGYVVALPTFPLSHEGIAYGDDYVNQPADISFVIDELVGLADDDSLAGLVDDEHIAVGGHSLGGATVLGVAYNSCCVDERIDATIQSSGGPLPYDGGDYDHRPPTPMLLVHGVLDGAVPIGVGDAEFDNPAGPTTYLRLAEADHTSVFDDASGALFDDAALAFLDSQLKDDTERLDGLAAEVTASGIAELRTSE